MSTHSSASKNSADRTGLLAAGNWIVDRVKTIEAWPEQDALVSILGQTAGNGGGPYNVLKDLAKLGAPFPLAGLGLLGDDADGRMIRADCAAHGIDASRLQTTERAPTSYTDVMTARDTGRRTFFHARGANALLGPDHFDFSGVSARWFYLGYLLLLDALDASDADAPDGAPRARAVLRRAREAGLLTAVDCVSARAERFGGPLRLVLPETDVLFANDYEAEQLTGIVVGRDDALSRVAVERAGRALIAMGVRRHVVLHFPQGGCVVSADGSTVWRGSVRVPPERIVGTAGAGDAFAAGCLFGLHENFPIAEWLELGVCVAACSLLHPTCSESVPAAAEALTFGRAHGFRTLP